MAHFDIFDDRHLRDIVRIAIDENCIVRDIDGSPTLCFQDVPGITFQAGQRGLDRLSRRLRSLIPQKPPDEMDSLSELLAHAGIIARDFDLSLNCPPVNISQIELLKERVSIDFALLCTFDLANSLGHAISAKMFPVGEAKSALAGWHEDWLNRIFYDYLACTGPTAAADGGGNRGLMTSKSYWNLRSVADAEDWEEREVLRLLDDYFEEQLRLAESSDRVPYTNTISGDEWRQRYRRLFYRELQEVFAMRFGEQLESKIIASALGGESRFPFDPLETASRIGVLDIRRTDCSDGFTHFGPDGPVIYLSRVISGPRMRFVIAHELAHVMLRIPEAIEVIRERGQSRLLDDEERLANRIAGTLLVPDYWVEAIKEADLAPATLEHIARTAGIPISMLITRMSNAGVDIALLHWRRGRRSWHVIDRPGVPSFMNGQIRLSEIGFRAMERLGGQESDIAVDCRVNGRHVGISGIGYRRGWRFESALQFLAPKRDVWFLMR